MSTERLRGDSSERAPLFFVTHESSQRSISQVSQRTRTAFRLLAAITVIAVTGSARPQTPTEYQVKATYLYNFSKFVEWPANLNGDQNTPIIIGILGDDPFGPEIERTINGKTSNGRRLAIKRFPNLRALEYCHILFISASERNSLRQTLAAVGPGVLTVGEADHFVQTGGIINFVFVENTVHFEINKVAAERAGLKISAKLLNIAHPARN